MTNILVKIAEALLTKLVAYLYDIVINYLEDKKTEKKVLATRNNPNRQDAAGELDDTF